MKDKFKKLSARRIFLLLFVVVVTGYFGTINLRYTLVQGQQESHTGTYGYKVENYSFKYGMRITIWETTTFDRLFPHTEMKLVYDLPNLRIDKVVESEWIKSDGAVYLNIRITYRDPLDSSMSTKPARIIYDFHKGEMYIVSDFTLWRLWSERLSYDNWMSESEFNEILAELRQ